jgi:hypothetical protein
MEPPREVKSRWGGRMVEADSIAISLYFSRRVLTNLPMFFPTFLSATRKNFQHQIHEQRNIERDKKQSGDAELVSAAREDVRCFPVEIF